MATEERLADFTKSNQKKLSPEMQEKARTEKHPADETDAPQPLADGEMPNKLTSPEATVAENAPRAKRAPRKTQE